MHDIIILLQICKSYICIEIISNNEYLLTSKYTIEIFNVDFFKCDNVQKIALLLFFSLKIKK